MANERLVKLIHLPLFAFLALVSLITMSISASLVAYGNNNGYPSTSIRDRDRIILVAGIWTTFFSIYLVLGTLFAASSVAFGILVHLVTVAVGFILYLIGAASLTATMIHRSCGGPDGFPRCNVTKGEEVMAWISTIISFVALIFVLVLGIKSRSGTGMRRGTLVNA